MKLSITKKSALVLVIVLAVLLNFCAFYFAYSQTSTPEAPNLARDFSAYYIGGWRLFHNPSQVYHSGNLTGDYPIQPLTALAQPFKYIPSFLILFAPFLALNYQNALSAFDVVQFLLIPLLAFFVYKLVEDKSIFLGVMAALIVLVDPILFSNSISYNSVGFLQSRLYNLHFHMVGGSLIGQSFSPMYYCGYLLVNAHILQGILIVGALYFGFARKPAFSAFLFAFGAFDPRAALFAVPLLLWYNRNSILKFFGWTAAFFAVTNLPFFFYYGVGFSFLGTEINGSIASAWFLYDWIPIYSVVALTVVELITELYDRKVILRLQGLKI